MGRRRVLSGMRPTGKLHLGNYMGALYNWVRLQHEYECYFFFVADWHALTTGYENTTALCGDILEMAVDFLAAGASSRSLCTIFVQSAVPQHSVLTTLLSNITPLSWLERVPSYKDQQEQLREKDLATFGFSGVSAAAVGGYFAVPAAPCAGGAGPGFARGADAGGGAAVQPALPG